jgi:hypothetical protein
MGSVFISIGLRTISKLSLGVMIPESLKLLAWLST